MDNFSCFTWLYPTKHKSKVLPIFLQLQKLLENHFDKKNKISQCDEGLEFDNHSLKDHCIASGIHFQKSCVETQAQHGVTEHKNKHNLETIRTFLIQSLLPSTG